MAGFRFAPRTLLELGRELISSDEVALYELIKNSIDAGSRQVQVSTNIVLLHSAYIAAVEALDDGEEVDNVFENKIKSVVYQGAGRERLQDFLRPLEAAIEEPDGFRKALAKSYVEHNWIDIRDTGHGMTLEDLDEIYLTVGTRSRRSKNIEGAKFLGDKGVGRLSSMRLGDRLRVTTSAAGERRWNVLDINWALFTHETEGELEDISVELLRGEKKEDPGRHGTTARISHLNSDWGVTRFEGMFQGEIARMVDPFEPTKGNDLLHVRYNGTRVLVPSISEKLLKSAHATCSVSFDFLEDEPILKGIINYKLKHKKIDLIQKGAEIYSVAQKSWKRRGKKGLAATEIVPIRPSAFKALGPFKVEVYWFNRRVVEEISGLTGSKASRRNN